MEGNEATVSTRTQTDKSSPVAFDRSNLDECSFVDVEAACEDTDSVSCVTLVASKVPKAQETFLSTCAICLEEKPLVRVLNKCCHPQACFECLRMQYIVQSQKSHENYPVKCFWPGCDRRLRDVHIQRFVKRPCELARHYELEWTAKGRRAVHRHRIQEKVAAERRQKQEKAARAVLQRRRAERLKTRYPCPSCATENVICIFVECEATPLCMNCSQSLELDTISQQEILSVLEAVGDDLVNCPSCSAILVKEGGCDHMTCVCEAEFSFHDARHVLDAGRKLTNISR